MADDRPPAIELHPATAGDIPVLRGLAERIWRSSYADMLTPAQIDYMLGWMYGADTIAAEMDGGVLWYLALGDGSPVGFLAVAVDEPPVADLNKLYLLPELQGRGHGQRLLARAMAIASARACTVLRLRVNKTNARALRAYRKAGFVEVDAVVAEIGGGFVMDDYVLARPVGPGA